MSKKGGGKDKFWGYEEYDSAMSADIGSVGGVIAPATRCYESHPILQIGGGTLIGGSCGYPVVKDADVYVALDGWSKKLHPNYPWSPKTKGPIEINFTITDMAAPIDSENFVAMIDWLIARLAEGKKVHVGCVGGHGRTGMVISAIVAKVNANKDAIQWVRENYCKKAVETKAQVKFLVGHFGVSEVLGTKTSNSTFQGTGANLGSYYGPDSTGVERKGPPVTSARSEYRKQGNLIPGTSMERTKGPRDLSTFIKALPKSNSSIW